MSGHAGAAGVYAALPLKADMVGLYSAVANANHMPLAGGAEPLLGTNPLAIAIPAGKEPPVVLDIATSIVSYGTIKNHRLQNKPLAGDWMIDPKTGEAVVDPHKSAEALLLPMAGYKGAGLALMLGLLAGTLNGALFGRDCVDFNAEPDKVTNTGQFVVALDPAAFSRSTGSRPKSTGTSASCATPRRCPASLSGCPANSVRSVVPTGFATGYRFLPSCSCNSTSSQVRWRSSRCANASRPAPANHITAVFFPLMGTNRIRPSSFVSAGNSGENGFSLGKIFCRIRSMDVTEKWGVVARAGRAAARFASCPCPGPSWPR